MSRIQKAMTRALKATAGDLEEIVKIDGLTKQDRYVLHTARKICERLMSGEIRNRVSSPPTPTATPKPDQHASDSRAHHQPPPQKLFANHGKPWLPNETGIIQNAVTLAKAKGVEIDVHALSAQLGRSPFSVASKLVQYGFLNKEWSLQFRT